MRTPDRGSRSLRLAPRIALIAIQMSDIRRAATQLAAATSTPNPARADRPRRWVWYSNHPVIPVRGAGGEAFACNSGPMLSRLTRFQSTLEEPTDSVGGRESGRGSGERSNSDRPLAISDPARGGVPVVVRPVLAWGGAANDGVAASIIHAGNGSAMLDRCGSNVGGTTASARARPPTGGTVASTWSACNGSILGGTPTSTWLERSGSSTDGAAASIIHAGNGSAAPARCAPAASAGCASSRKGSATAPMCGDGVSTSGSPASNRSRRSACAAWGPKILVTRRHRSASASASDANRSTGFEATVRASSVRCRAKELSCTSVCHHSNASRRCRSRSSLVSPTCLMPSCSSQARQPLVPFCCSER